MSSPTKPPGQQRDFEGPRYRRDSTGSSPHDSARRPLQQPDYYDFSENDASNYQGNGRQRVPSGQHSSQNGERGNPANVSRGPPGGSGGGGGGGGGAGGQGGAPPSPRSRIPSYRGAARSEDTPSTAPTSNMKVPAESQLARISRQARRQAYAAAAAGSDDVPPQSAGASGSMSRDVPSNMGGGGNGRGSSVAPPLSRRALLQQDPQQQLLQAQQSRPSGPSPPESIGTQIQRLNSPSVATSVLQPLDAKVGEYSGMMAAEQAVMARLDEELHVLEERRREAEARFIEAKSKHDEYQQQYEDVQRVLRGELSRLQMEQQQQQLAAQQLAQHEQQREQQQQQQQALNSPTIDQLRSQRADSFGSIDMRPESRHSAAKLKRRERWRMTLFGNGSS